MQNKKSFVVRTTWCQGIHQPTHPVGGALRVSVVRGEHMRLAARPHGAHPVDVWVGLRPGQAADTHTHHAALLGGRRCKAEPSSRFLSLFSGTHSFLLYNLLVFVIYGLARDVSQI